MGWERLAHVALSSSADAISSGTFTAKNNLRILVNLKSTGGTIESRFTVNSDTGSNYCFRYSENGASDSTSSGAYHIGHDTSSGGSSFCVMDIVNIDNEEKFIRKEFVSSGTGAGTAPTRSESVSKYTTKSGQITSIQVNNVGGGDFDTGSYITVLGAKEPDADSDSLSVTGIDEKKHLMVQIKGINSGQINPSLRFNNDSGNNYARRESLNGGTDSTQTSQALIQLSSSTHPQFATIHIINISDKEKLVLSDTISRSSAGAGAPDRWEVVGKWANTSNAITRVDIINGGSGDFTLGSEVTVYGTD